MFQSLDNMELLMLIEILIKIKEKLTHLTGNEDLINNQKYYHNLQPQLQIKTLSILLKLDINMSDKGFTNWELFPVVVA